MATNISRLLVRRDDNYLALDLPIEIRRSPGLFALLARVLIKDIDVPAAPGANRSLAGSLIVACLIAGCDISGGQDNDSSWCKLVKSRAKSSLFQSNGWTQTNQARNGVAPSGNG